MTVFQIGWLEDMLDAGQMTSLAKRIGPDASHYRPDDMAHSSPFPHRLGTPGSLPRKPLFLLDRIIYR